MDSLPMTCEYFCLVAIIVLCNTKDKKPSLLPLVLYGVNTFKPALCFFDRAHRCLKVRLKYFNLFDAVG